MNTLRRGLVAAVAVAMMAVVAPHARADIYGTTYFSGAFGVEMKGNQYSNTQAGTFTTYLANNSAGIGAKSYISYCIDLKHYTSPGTYNVLDNTPTQLPYTDKFAPNSSNMLGNTAWDQAGMGRAAWLVNTFGNGLTTDAQRGLLQVAVWKVIYSSESDTANFADITKGSEYTTSLTTAQVNTVNSYLAASVAAGGGTYATASALWVNFKDVTANHVQFQVIGAPEPSSLAIAGLGLLGFVGMARRRMGRA